MKNNDESFDKIYITEGGTGDDDDYIPDEGEDLGWLGYYIGQNTKLQVLNFYKAIGNESFYKEMSHNKSINNVYYHATPLNIFRMMGTFLKNNNKLEGIDVEVCEFGAEDAPSCSLSCRSSSVQLLVRLLP